MIWIWCFGWQNRIPHPRFTLLSYVVPFVNVPKNYKKNTNIFMVWKRRTSLVLYIKWRAFWFDSDEEVCIWCCMSDEKMLISDLHWSYLPMIEVHYWFAYRNLVQQKNLQNSNPAQKKSVKNLRFWTNTRESISRKIPY